MLSFEQYSEFLQLYKSPMYSYKEYQWTSKIKCEARRTDAILNISDISQITGIQSFTWMLLYEESVHLHCIRTPDKYEYNDSHLQQINTSNQLLLIPYTAAVYKLQSKTQNITVLELLAEELLLYYTLLHSSEEVKDVKFLLQIINKKVF